MEAATAVPEVVILNLLVGQLETAEHNPNVMDPREFKLLVEAIRTMGFLQPILVRQLEENVYPEESRYRVIDGHHRLAAGIEVGMPKVPCVVVQKDEDEEQILRIAMNKLRGELDLTGVGRIMQELTAAGWEKEELKLTGFSMSEITDLLAAVSQPADVHPQNIEVPSDDKDYDPDDTDDASSKLFELKVLFDNRDDLKKVKRALRRAGGKTKDMSVGLMKLLAEESKPKEAAP